MPACYHHNWPLTVWGSRFTVFGSSAKLTVEGVRFEVKDFGLKGLGYGVGCFFYERGCGV